MFLYKLQKVPSESEAQMILLKERNVNIYLSIVNLQLSTSEPVPNAEHQTSARVRSYQTKLPQESVCTKLCHDREDHG